MSHHLIKRQEICCCSTSDLVFDGRIHQTRLLVAKIKWLICDVIQDFLSLQKISHNIQDYSQNGTTPDIQMMWVIYNVISLHRLLERWEILYCCRSDLVFDGGIHQTWLNEVIPLWCNSRFSCHWRKTINPWELIFPWKWSDFCVMWYLYICDEKGERFNPVAWRITYLMEIFTKRDCC